MVSEEKLERLRRVPQYSGWSEELVDLWNRSVKLWSKIKYLSAKELHESRTGNEKYRTRIEDIREEVTDLRGRIERFGWIEQPVDPRFLTGLETRKKLPVVVPEEGISFGDMISRVLQVLEEAEEERIVEIWQPVLYTYTFIYRKRGQVKRHVEAHLEGKIKANPSTKEEAKDKAFSTIESLLQQSDIDYSFMVGVSTKGVDYIEKYEKGKKERVTLEFELFDYDYSELKAHGTGNFSPPEWWAYRVPTIVRGIKYTENIGTKGPSYRWKKEEKEKKLGEEEQINLERFGK